MVTILSQAILAQAGPKYLNVCNGIAQLIIDGRLRPGDRLPPQRDLADTLKVTLGTVTRGYREAEKRGLLVGETGRGTFVRAGQTDRFSLHALHNRTDREFTEQIHFDLNFPMEEGTPDLCAALTAVARSSDVSALLRYQPAAGLLHQRQAALRWVSRFGVNAEVESLVITVGAQHAIQTVLISQGSIEGALAVESFTYPGILNAARLLKRHLVQVSMDDQGMVPDALDAACRQQKISGLYLMPTIQNPTNAAMTETRRMEIVDVARSRNLFIIEDDVYGPFKDQYPKPIQALAPERTFYVTNLSKVAAPGLRVGYLVAPPEKRRHVETAMSASVWMAPPLMGEIAGRWIEDGTVQKALTIKRVAAIRRLAIVRRMLGETRLDAQSGSLHAWFRLPDAWQAEAFAAETAIRGVSVIPSGSFCATPHPVMEAVRICFGAPPTEADVETGIAVLARLAKEIPPPVASLI